MIHAEKEKKYIIWQNSAYRFYIASRLLYFKDLVGPTVFCGQQALELLLKATLVYWDKSFQPEAAGHKFTKMIRALKNKAKINNIEIPQYFYLDQKYQSVSRYPQGGKGILMPASYLDDLDKSFKELIILVPFQFNSELINTLQDNQHGNTYLNTLRRNNNQIRVLREFLKK